MLLRHGALFWGDQLEVTSVFGGDDLAEFAVHVIALPFHLLELGGVLGLALLDVLRVRLLAWVAELGSLWWMRGSGVGHLAGVAVCAAAAVLHGVVLGELLLVQLLSLL